MSPRSSIARLDRRPSARRTQPGGSQIPLRDFVYLDWERVRSLAAQLLHGVPQEAMEETGKEVKGNGHIEGSLPFLIKGQAGADLRYFSTQNETRSFHHYVYSLVEQELSARGFLTPIDSAFDFSLWKEGFFRDGQFVRVTGVVRLMDYGWIAAMLDAWPKMMRTTLYYQAFGPKNELERKLKAGEITPKQFDDSAKQMRRDQDRQLHEIEVLKIDELTGLIQQLYGNAVRLKVLPNRQNADKVFVGSGIPENFHDTASSLSQKYGYEVDAGWVSLGQINASTVVHAPMPIPIGNQIEDSLETLALNVSNVVQVASAAKFPAVSFTPISIYRTTPGG